jgi:uncharacterized protein YecE (DUF72 family)
LSRYSQVLRGTEINSSFYRAHSSETYAKWAATTPRGFRFAVKMPQTITHECALKRARRPLEQFLSQVAGLERKLGPLLVQLPPSLQFEARAARTFFSLLRELHAGAVVCEPRHPSWFTVRANDVLIAHRVGRVAADPAKVDMAAEPGGWLDPGKSLNVKTRPTVYYRLHGSPRMYWSVYGAEVIKRWAQSLCALPRRIDIWCIFDNTAGGGAIVNAQQMVAELGSHRVGA